MPYTDDVNAKPPPPPPPPKPKWSKEAKEAWEKMKAFAAYAKAQNGGKSPGGMCARGVRLLMQAHGYPGAQLGSMGFISAKQYGYHLNTGNNARAVGLEKLNITNPYDAPPGSIIVIKPGHNANATHGDINIAVGGGQFINDGNMQLASRGSWSADDLIGIYAPIGASEIPNVKALAGKPIAGPTGDAGTVTPSGSVSGSTGTTGSTGSTGSLGTCQAPAPGGTSPGPYVNDAGSPAGQFANKYLTPFDMTFAQLIALLKKAGVDVKKVLEKNASLQNLGPKDVIKAGTQLELPKDVFKNASPPAVQISPPTSQVEIEPTDDAVSTPTVSATPAPDSGAQAPASTTPAPDSTVSTPVAVTTSPAPASPTPGPAVETAAPASTSSTPAPAIDVGGGGDGGGAAAMPALGGGGGGGGASMASLNAALTG
jgi:hypothetical protein